MPSLVHQRLRLNMELKVQVQNFKFNKVSETSVADRHLFRQVTRQALCPTGSRLEVLDDEVLPADGVHDHRRPSSARPGLELLVRRLPPLLVRHSPWCCA